MFNVAISERQIATLIMTVGWHIPPFLVKIFSDRGIAELGLQYFALSSMYRKRLPHLEPGYPYISTMLESSDNIADQPCG